MCVLILLFLTLISEIAKRIFLGKGSFISDQEIEKVLRSRVSSKNTSLKQEISAGDRIINRLKERLEALLRERMNTLRILQVWNDPFNKRLHRRKDKLNTLSVWPTQGMRVVVNVYVKKMRRCNEKTKKLLLVLKKKGI